MKRVKLINDPADLVSLFHSVDSDARREILSLLSQGWTAISVLTEQFGDEANAAISFFEKFKLRLPISGIIPDAFFSPTG